MPFFMRFVQGELGSNATILGVKARGGVPY
jgi:hypothetical protein